MSSELHELIEKELAAADNRIEKGAGAGGAVRVHSLQVEAARRKSASEGKSLEDKARAALAYATDVAKLWFGRAKLSYAGASARPRAPTRPAAPYSRSLPAQSTRSAGASPPQSPSSSSSSR